MQPQMARAVEVSLPSAPLATYLRLAAHWDAGTAPAQPRSLYDFAGNRRSSDLVGEFIATAILRPIIAAAEDAGRRGEDQVRPVLHASTVWLLRAVDELRAWETGLASEEAPPEEVSSLLRLVVLVIEERATEALWSA